MASKSLVPSLCINCLSLRSKYSTAPLLWARRRRRRLWSTRFRLLSADAKPSQSSNKTDSTTTNQRSEKDDLLAAPESPAETVPEPELGPMARRLEDATEDVLLSGGRSGRRAVEDAGFSNELKERLLNKLADAAFRAEHAAALTEAGLSPSPASTELPTAAQPWTGDEAPADAVLRMLDDAHKPLRPGLRGQPVIPTPTRPVDMRLRREPVLSAGRRAAAARERAVAYAATEAEERGLSDEEREAVRREFRERFAPGARPLPNTISGLAALANERIEDAIARGQFKDIPRGKGVKRDARVDNPFIDTTEYIMNNMIKRQEIVPPWIEKQKELVKAANVFRARLRSDWKRHAARLIASRGGPLQEQMRRADDYARAEKAHNPRRRNVDQISVPTNATDDVVMVKMREQAWASNSPASAPDATLPSQPDAQTSVTAPFRDLSWEAAERAYMQLAIANLNALTRSYNLLAPELAKKPYFSLERELAACFADVAPQLAGTIKERAAGPSRSMVDPLGGGGDQGLAGGLDRFGREAGRTVRVYDSKAPYYGLKEMWKDLWKRST